jgi:hypothetical protein
MKAGKWIVATAMLAMALSAGAFAEDHDWNRSRGRDDTPYTIYHRDRDDRWNNGYRDRDDRYRNNGYRADRDHQRRDRDNHGQDRD